MVAFASVAAGIISFAVGAVAYLGGGLGGFDFGFYLQAAHLISQGIWNPVVPAIHGHTYISDDLELYMYVLAALFKVIPSAWLLLGAQALMFAAVVALAGGYAIRRGIHGAWLAILLAIVVTYPPASDAIGGFHWDLLAGVIGFGMLLALMDGRLWWAAVFAALVLPVREDAGLVVASVAAIYLALEPGWGQKQKVAVALGIAGLLATGLAMTWIMPALSPGHAAFMQHTLFGNATSMRAKILSALQSLLWPAKWGYAAHLMLPLLLLPLLRPRFWPAIAIATVVNWLPLDANFYSGYFQYTGAALPALFAATAEGWLVVRSVWNTRSAGSARLVIGIAGEFLWLSGLVLYGSLLSQTAGFASQIGSPRMVALQREHQIVGDASLLTSDADVAYVGNATTHIVPTSPQESSLPLFVRGLGTRYIELSDPPLFGLTMGPVSPYIQVAEQAGYQPVYQVAGTTLLERGAHYRPLRVELASAGTMFPHMVRTTQDGTLYTFAEAKTVSGWVQADVQIAGQGEMAVCAVWSDGHGCSRLEYLTGEAMRPVGFYLSRPEAVSIAVVVQPGTNATLKVLSARLIRLKVSIANKEERL